MPDRKFFLWIFAGLSVFASALLYYFSIGVEGIRLLAWIAPVPLLAFSVTKATGKQTVIAAFTVFFIGNLVFVPYLDAVTPLVFILIYITLVSTVFSFAVAGFRYVALRYPNILPAIFFAASWTTWELLWSLLSPHGTAFSMAYTQSGFLPFVQLASVTGMWGLTFFLLFVPSCFVMAWYNRMDMMKALKIAFVPLMMFFVIFYFGFIRLHQQVHVKTIHAGLAASDTSVGYFATTNRAEALAVISAFKKRLEILAYEGSEIIVLPEKFVGVTHAYQTEVIRLLEAAARENKIFLVAGLNLTGGDKNRNRALVISPEGQILRDYDKRYFIPGAEMNYVRGSEPGLFDMNGTRSGVQICKDLDFPAWSRRYSREGARIMFVPAWDFTVDAWLHSRMAVMRAVENGFSLVRCAQEGNLTITDYRGKVIAEGSTVNKPDLLVEGNVIPGPGHTFYSLTGNWFAYMNVFFIIVLLLYPKTIKIISRISKK